MVTQASFFTRLKSKFLGAVNDAPTKLDLGTAPSQGRQFTPSPDPMPAWRDTDLPAEIGKAQTMMVKEEQQVLFTLAQSYFTGQGCIVDAGCFLGGSTLPLAHGLKANARFGEFDKEPLIFSYDLFVVEPWTIGIYFETGTPLDSSFLDVYESNIEGQEDVVSVHAGDVTQAHLPEKPIEILFIDLSKHWTINNFVVQAFFSRLIPGHSMVIQQDYLYHEWNGWLPVTMEYFADYFELVDHATVGSVVFRYIKEIPEAELKRDFFAELTKAEIHALGTKAAMRWQNTQQTTLLASRDHLAEVLASQNWA
ncbi:MAG: hypothetical protein AAGK38_05725 [Pseudomonadota bacterium]